MKTGFKIMIIVIISLILCSCSFNEVSNTGSNVSDEFNLGDSDTEESQNNEENREVNLTNLHKLVELYEESGYSVSEYTSKNFIMKLVEVLELKDKYVKYKDGYEIFTMSTEQARGVLSLFIVNQYPVEIYDDEIYFSYSQDIILEPFDIDISNDEIKVLYGRFVEGKNGEKHWLYPVQYTMNTYIIDGGEVPDILKGYLKDGEIGFRIKNIENINNIGSAEEIYCDNGYDTLFEEKSYEISSVDDLLAMAERVNNSMYNEIHATYTLTCDLDMKDIDYTPIGNCEWFIPGYDERNPVDYGFCGIFEGNGHTISNLRYIRTAYKYDGTGPDNNIGMFARLGSGSVVRNLNIKGAYMDYVKDKSFTETGIDYINVCGGILAASFEGNIIENCNVNGIVYGITSVGGLVGDVNGSGSIINCRSDADVYGESWVGGLSGGNSGAYISNCTAEGTVSGDRFSPRNDIDMPIGIGGFVGLNGGIIENCGASVWVKTMVNCRCVGSFAGMNDREIINCIYNSTIGNWNAIGESYEYSGEVNDAAGYQRDEYYEKLTDEAF